MAERYPVPTNEQMVGRDLRLSTVFCDYEVQENPTEHDENDTQGFEDDTLIRFASQMDNEIEKFATDLRRNLNEWKLAQIYALKNNAHEQNLTGDKDIVYRLCRDGFSYAQCYTDGSVQNIEGVECIAYSNYWSKNSKHNAGVLLTAAKSIMHAELRGLCRALEVAESLDLQNIQLNCDSTTAIACCNDAIMLASPDAFTPVVIRMYTQDAYVRKQMGLIRRYARGLHSVKLVWTPAHTGKLTYLAIGNDKADELAKRAAKGDYSAIEYDM